MGKIVSFLFIICIFSACATKQTSSDLLNDQKGYSKKNNEILNKIEKELYVNKDRVPEIIKDLPFVAINDYGQSAYHLAVETKNIATIKYLMDNKYNKEVQDEFGSTPLMLAVKLNFSEVTKLFIENGSDINQSDMFGETPLLRSITSAQDTVIIKILGTKTYKVSSIEKTYLEEYYLKTSNQHLRRLILNKTR